MKRIFFLSVLFSVLAICLHAQPTELMIKKGNQGLYLDHKVAPKEGLYAIGRLYNVNPKFIAIYNQIDLNAGLAIGQTIHIPLTDTNFTQSSINGTPVYYVAGSNENLSKVSNANNKVALQKLRDWNGLQNDNLSPGTKLIVGFLDSKEMAAVAINNTVKLKGATATKTVAQTEQVEKKEEPKPLKADGNLKKKEEPTEKRQADGQPAKSEPVSAVSREMTGVPINTNQGYFKASFDLQSSRTPASKNATVTSGIFKTSSGWQDAKYYMLIDNVPTGTIVKIINPANSKAIYAKVLGEMKGIRQNEGLDIRISNAAAATLGVTDTEKFILNVNY